MVRGTSVIVLLAFTVRSQAKEQTLDNLIDHLITKLFAASPADLAETALAKPGLGKLGLDSVQLPKPKAAVDKGGLAFLKEQGKKAAAVALAGTMMLAPLSGAEAARSGGRVGGRAGFSARSAAPSPRAPAASATPNGNVVIAPRLSIGGPSLGYGYSASPFGGGFGYGYGYGGGMSSGTVLGLSLFDMLLREQQRQRYLEQQLRTQQQLGRDQAMIQQLQAELKTQDAKVEGLKKETTGGDADKIKLLEKQLAEQQKQIESLTQKESR